MKRPRRMQRLLAPRSIALIGRRLDRRRRGRPAAPSASPAKLWRVHPKRALDRRQTPTIRSVEELPGSARCGLRRRAEPRGAGDRRRARARAAPAASCASRRLFRDRHRRRSARSPTELLRAPGDLPFFGPNCYGFVNFFDGVALWPDQVVGRRRERGVALICQSGTIALKLMFNERSVPIGYVFTVGNQTRLAVEDLIELLCDDARVTAFGLYLEGIKDMPTLCARRRAARACRQADRRWSRAGARRRPRARRTAIPARLPARMPCSMRFAGRPASPAAIRWRRLCETLKLLHAGGPLPGATGAGHGGLGRRHGDDGGCGARPGSSSSRRFLPSHARPRCARF